MNYAHIYNSTLFRRVPKSLSTDNVKKEGDSVKTEANAGSVKIPRPLTNATEISTKIDKLVRNWATESQKTLHKKKLPPLVLPSLKTQVKDFPIASLALVDKPKVDKKKITLAPPAEEKVKNKNLERISQAFRKSLEPISNRNVNDLIKLPEDDEEDEDIGKKLDNEHAQRRRIHESVFRNVIMADSLLKEDPDKGQGDN